jgi:hypothetical protein
MVQLTVVSRYEHLKCWENFLDHAGDVLYADPDYDKNNHLSHWQRVIDVELKKYHAKGISQDSRRLWWYHKLEFPDEQSLVSFVLAWS